MVKISLQIKVQLENVEEIRGNADEEFRWYLKLKCTSCGEINNSWQYVCLAESLETKGGRGSASMVQKCKICKRENHLDILKEYVKSYGAENDGTFVGVVAFECRGLEPIDFEIRSGWDVCCGSNKIFEDVDLSEKEWYDYNDQNNDSVSITEIEHQFIKLKK